MTSNKGFFSKFAKSCNTFPSGVPWSVLYWCIFLFGYSIITFGIIFFLNFHYLGHSNNKKKMINSRLIFGMYTSSTYFNEKINDLIKTKKSVYMVHEWSYGRTWWHPRPLFRKSCDRLWSNILSIQKLC